MRKKTKKVLIVTILCLSTILFIATLYLQGTIFRQTPNPSLQIYVENDTTKNENITVVVYDYNIVEIYNKTILVRSKEFKSLGKITDREGSYIIKAYVDENRTTVNDTIKVKAYYASVHIVIHVDGIRIYQERI